MIRSSQAAVDLIVADRLKELLNYEPITGEFRWLVSPARHVKIGDIAGCIEAKGYRIIKIYGRAYKAHGLAWLYMTGHWPVNLIDHKYRDPGNCRWADLRAATYSQNAINAEKPVGRSGLKGAAWSERAGKWKSSIRISGKRLFLGYFDSPEKAHVAYAAKAIELHGEFARVT